MHDDLMNYQLSGDHEDIDLQSMAPGNITMTEAL